MRNAIEAMNGQNLDGRNITANEAQSRGSGGGRRSGGGHSSGGGDTAVAAAMDGVTVETEVVMEVGVTADMVTVTVMVDR